MKSFGLILAVVSAAGTLTMTASKALPQTPRYGESLVSERRTATYQHADEITLVQAKLNEFDSALAAHDVGGLQAIGIKRVTAKRWLQFFKDNPRATVTDQCLLADLSISGNAASWTCTETATIISEEKPKAFVHLIRFMFAKTGGEWTIADRR
jgi:hypothetical protein